MKITVATYNVLAAAYVSPKYYPNCRPTAFAAARRYPRIVRRAAGLGADVVCLQEVDYKLFSLLEKRLMVLGYQGRWAHKGNAKVDGCATFVRRPWICREARILSFNDGGARKPVGHVALITTVERSGTQIMVVNTHLKWEDPNAPQKLWRGQAQAKELLAAVAALPVPRIVCGDFNAETGDHVLAAFRAAGFEDAHDVAVATCNPNGRAVKIDYLMHSDAFTARPGRAPEVADSTPLPSAKEPSDHIPLIATFTLGI